MSDLDAFNSDLTVQVGQKYLKDYSLKSEDIDSDETKEGWKLLDLVPSIKGTGYDEYLAVENGKLVLKMDADVDDATKEIIEKKLGKAALTKEMILKEPEKYIGMQIKYAGYSESTNTIDWRIFGLDLQGNLMLKANDHVNLEYKEKDYPTGIAQGKDIYNIKSTTDRETLVSYLETSSNWNEYAISGKTTARGAMTLPEFVEGYNRVNDEDLAIEYLTEGETNDVTANVDGYVIKKGIGSYNWHVSEITETTSTGMNFYLSDDSNADFIWLASVSAHVSRYVMGVLYNGNVDRGGYGHSTGVVCPVVSLTSAILVENVDGEIEVQ